VTDPIVAFDGVLEGIQKVLAVLIIFEYGLLLVPAGCDVVNCTGIFYAEGMGHIDATVAQKKTNVKIQDVTL